MEQFEECQQSISKLVSDNSRAPKNDLNEATTRSRIIDSLFFDCLDWSRNTVEMEECIDNKYSDYSFKNRSSYVLVVEAKKTGEYFQIPVSRNDQLIYPIKSLIKGNKNLKEAMTQVGHYCQQRGVEIGVISNGNQLVAFVSNRNDGIKPLDGKCIVFESLQKIEKQFLDFWNCLSILGIENKELKKRLSESYAKPLPPKMSTVIENYPGNKGRNIFQSDLQIISELVFEDTINDSAIEKEFLKECYCNSGALSEYALLSKNILRTRYDYIFEENENPTILRGVSDKHGITDDFNNIPNDGTLIKRPIILIGDVGSGKSTFINHLIKVDAENIFKSSFTFKIDLGSQAILTKDIRDTIIDIIEGQLLTDYSIDIKENKFVRLVYESDLARFRNGINKPYYDNNNPIVTEKEIEYLETLLIKKDEHLKRSLIYCNKQKRKQTIIFIDNCDQRNDDSQQTAFLVAQEIAQNWNSIVFITLRPETFFQSTKTGTLSAYYPKVFSISPPRVDLVLEKRFAFARRIANGDIPILKDKKSEIKIRLENLKIIINTIDYSFKNNKDLLELLENISNSNIRLILELVMGFIGSGHVDTEKIIEIEKEGNDIKHYLIPLHEFLRAIIYMDGIFYNPNGISPITNIFNTITFDQKEHFLLPIILEQLLQQSKSGINHGFIETNDIIKKMQSIGFFSDQINEVLKFAHKRKLLDISEKTEYLTDEPPKSLRITATGAYHIEILSHNFPYIDAMVIDTPIYSNEFKEKIFDVSEIQDRLERCKLFISYLDDSWKLIDKTYTSFDWQKHSDKLREEIESIKEILEAKYGQDKNS